MVNRYCIMYKYNSINHTNEKTEAFYCLKNNYDKEKTKYYTSPLSDNRNHIIAFSQYFRYRRQWKQVRAGRYKRLAADSRAMPGSGIHGRTDKTACLLPTRRVQGKLHSREHREKSGTAYSTATVKRNPQKKGKFRLCIDGMPILEWFKMKFKELKEKLGVGHTPKEKNRPQRELRI